MIAKDIVNIIIVLQIFALKTLMKAKVIVKAVKIQAKIIPKLMVNAGVK